MPRKPRIDIPGYYHIINRGVNRDEIFLGDEDKAKFLEFLDISREIYQLTIHSFCLLDNHYHLLLETSHKNLSLAVRYINSRYAAWFNNKYNRIGPLWQGRFKSWYIHDDAYLWLLLRYIEMNPVEAAIAQAVGDYRFSASYFLVNSLSPSLLTGSCLFQKDFCEWIILSDVELEALEGYQSARLKQKDSEVKVKIQLSLHVFFPDNMSHQQRNYLIYKAFHDGYKQSQIARYLGLSTVAVSRIVGQERQKGKLFLKVRDKGLLWSYSPTIEFSPDKQSLMIETILKYADIDDIKEVLKLYGKRVVVAVWNERIRTDIRFKKLNYFLARVFFDMDVEADQFNEVSYARADKLRLLAG